MRRALSILLVLSTCSLARATHLDWNTNFETINSNLFSIGVSPETATFDGDAFSGVQFIEELYHSGSHAWMVNAGGIGRIEFETNAAEVDFYARTRSLASGDTVITAYDDSDGVIGSPITISAPSSDFSYVSFSGDIDYIERVQHGRELHELGRRLRLYRRPGTVKLVVGRVGGWCDALREARRQKDHG